METQDPTCNCGMWDTRERKPQEAARKSGAGGRGTGLKTRHYNPKSWLKASAASPRCRPEGSALRSQEHRLKPMLHMV